MALDKNIRELRKTKGMTQEQLASRIGVTRQTVSKWEQGLSVPDADLLSKLSDTFDVQVSELLGNITHEDMTSNDMAAYLAVLNEELAIRNRHRKTLLRIIKIVLIVIGVGFAALLLFIVFWSAVVATL